MEGENTPPSSPAPVAPMTDPAIFPLALGACLIGGIPFAWIAGKVSANIDIRQRGSGNLGAANAARVLGMRWGLTVLILDAGKGALCVALARTLTGPVPAPYIAALAAILGHIFSPWLCFRGGKGIAATAGAILALEPVLALPSIGVFLVAFSVFRIISVASLSTVLILPVWALLKHLISPEPFDMQLIMFCTILIPVLFWSHRENIKRLRRGTEPRFRFPGKQ